jgi:hypothetical protein
MADNKGWPPEQVKLENAPYLSVKVPLTRLREQWILMGE